MLQRRAWRTRDGLADYFHWGVHQRKLCGGTTTCSGDSASVCYSVFKIAFPHLSQYWSDFMNRSGEEQEKLLALLDEETARQSNSSKAPKDQRECEALLTPHLFTWINLHTKKQQPVTVVSWPDVAQQLRIFARTEDLEFHFHDCLKAIAGLLSQVLNFCLNKNVYQVNKYGCKCSYYSWITIHHGSQHFCFFFLFFLVNPAFSAQECFQRIDRKLRATLKRKHVPKVRTVGVSVNDSILYSRKL